MLRLSNSLKFFLGSFVLLGYFMILVYTPIHMVQMADMNMPMEDCPFATGQHVICTMTISEHVREWQNWLQSFLPSIKLAAEAIILFALAHIFSLSQPILRLLLYCKRQGRTKTYSFLQNLFSQGILNSKVY